MRKANATVDLQIAARQPTSRTATMPDSPWRPRNFPCLEVSLTCGGAILHSGRVFGTANMSVSARFDQEFLE